MKKSFLVLAVLLMFGSSAFAIGGIDLGLKAGYQTARLSYNKADIKAGFAEHFTVGVFGRVGYGSIYVQPEILYFKTASIFDVDVTGTGSDNLFNIPTGADVSLTLNEMNLQVPILVGVKILHFGPVTLRAQAGPTANFLIKSNKIWGYTINGSDSEDADVPEEVTEMVNTKSIKWGMQAGVGADILGKITLDINYNFGLSKMFSKLNNTNLGNYFDFTQADNTRQSLFMVTVGFKLL